MCLVMRKNSIKYILLFVKLLKYLMHKNQLKAVKQLVTKASHLPCFEIFSI